MGILRSALLLAFAATSILASEPPDGWELIDDDEGVVVYKKEVSGSPVVAFRGVAELDATPEKVLGVLVDNDHRTEWVDLCSESRVLESAGEWEQVIYQRYTLPWYLSDRDYVYRARAVRNPDGSVELLLASCEHRDAPETVGVRARLIESRYVLTPLEGGKRCRLAVEIHTDPMGMVPKWLVNLVQEEWPQKTLNGVRKQLQRPHVVARALPPLEAARAVPAGARR